MVLLLKLGLRSSAGCASPACARPAPARVAWRRCPSQPRVARRL